MQLLFCCWLDWLADTPREALLNRKKSDGSVLIFSSDNGWKLLINPTRTFSLPQKGVFDAYSVQNPIQEQRNRVIWVWWAMHWFMPVSQLRHIFRVSTLPGEKSEQMQLSPRDLYRQKVRFPSSISNNWIPWEYSKVFENLWLVGQMIAFYMTSLVFTIYFILIFDK